MASCPAPETASSATLETIYACVAAELRQVESLLREWLRSPLPYIDQLVAHTVQYGGKRLRPALLLLTARTCGHLVAEHVALAAVVEMIHTATLVHDDVLDGAPMRRHRPTVHAAWGLESGILLGDYLFSQAFYRAAGTGRADVCRLIGEATNTVCAGELAQIANRGNLGLTEAQYLDIIDRKTAALCACACRLGALLAGAPEDLARAAERYGRLLGMGFQITDDLLDLVGQERRLGKPLGADIAYHKPTLPLIRLQAEADPPTRNLIERLWESDDPADLAALRQQIVSSRHIEEAFAEAQRLTRQACAHLAVLPPGPGREALDALARFVTQRHF